MTMPAPSIAHNAAPPAPQGVRSRAPARFGAEEAPDAARRTRSGRQRIGRIALDHLDRSDGIQRRGLVLGLLTAAGVGMLASALPSWLGA